MITLSKSKEKDFVILNLTDPQLLTSEWEETHIGRKILVYTVNKLVDEVKPDLITVSGDISVASFPEAYTKFADFLNGFGIPWTVAWGNHDNQGGAEVIDKYVAEYKTYNNFVYEEGPRELGNGNFVIGIREDDRTVCGIVMMDTHDRMPYKNSDGNEVMEWAKLLPQQLAWYESTVKQLQSEGCNETAIIAHIPIYAYRQAYEAAFKKDVEMSDMTFEKSLDGECWNEGYKDSFGLNFEGICSYPEDEGMMELISSLGSTKLYLCGHDHTNTSCINYRGTRLMYALKTGRGCYYKPGYNGGTVLRINSEGKIDACHHFCDEGID